MSKKYYSKIEEAPVEEIDKQQEEIIKAERPALRVQRFYGKPSVITYETNELTAVCPMTGLPDYYTLRIIYVPDKYIPELKSLKYYLLWYRDKPVFHEHLATMILEDFIKYVKPTRAIVELDVNIRGGIKTKVSVAWCIKNSYYHVLKYLDEGMV